MRALMQERQLLISTLIEHAARYHPHTEIVSRTCEGQIVRSNYATVRSRATKLAKALLALGIKPGDRVATLAWNTHRHLELYFAVSGIGAVLHTVNPRLFPEQIDYIVNHAEDQVLFFDITFAELVGKLKPGFKHTNHYVAMTDREHMPVIDGCLCYEEFLAAQDDVLEWPQFEETQASSLCYTSGTTGNPKGVLYSHRSTVLHSFTACSSDGLKLSSNDSVLLAVPLFHVNAWGIPYASAMCGAKVVLPGPWLDGKSLLELAEKERCNVSLGVPTVWLGVLKHIEDNPGLDLGQYCFERIVIGGSAAPRAIIERLQQKLGAYTIHAWGMSETSPLGTIGNLLPKHRDLPLDKQIDIRTKQGRAIYGVELRVVDSEGNALPHDGKSSGDLKVRGPWIASGYFKGEGGDVLDEGGWFATGDVAHIDPDGFIQITDRSKDVIKSGGEWISSIDLENAAVAHPGVQEAAVIGLPHPKWQERPLLLIVPKQSGAPSDSEILEFLSGRVAKWWLPDEVVFVDELPHTATGKLLKTKLREQYKDYSFRA